MNDVASFAEPTSRSIAPRFSRFQQLQRTTRDDYNIYII